MLTYGILIVLIIWAMALTYLVVRKGNKDKIVEEVKAPEEPVTEELTTEDENPVTTEEEMEKAPEKEEGEEPKTE